MLMDLKTLSWDKGMLETFDIKQECLPQIIPESSADFGIISQSDFSGVPITGIIGDQQSACLGHTLKKGEIKSTYGTGCFILMNSGTKPIHSKNGLLTTVMYKLSEDSPTNYALEGASECGGVTIEWAKNNLGLFKDFQEFDHLLSSVEDSGGVYFVPAFSGLFSPYWRNDVRGTILGMSLHTHRGHILKALTDSIFIRCSEIIKAMEQDCEGAIEIQKVMVDGGVTKNSGLMQTQADLLDKTVVTKKEQEITAIGAGIAAGLKVGMWENSSSGDFPITIPDAQKFTPSISNAKRAEITEKWSDAIDRSLGWT